VNEPQYDVTLHCLYCYSII